MNPMLMKYLLSQQPQEEEQPPVMPPAWQQGATVAPEAPPQQAGADWRDYLRGLSPELFSQGAVESAMESDATTNARNAGLRRMESGAAGFGLRAPDYSGMEPTRAGVQGLQARQQQALQSADVGSKVGQFAASQDAGDPMSDVSRKAWVRNAALYGDEFKSLFPRGASANEIAAWAADKKGAVASKKDANQADLYGSQKVKTDEEAATEAALRGGKVDELGAKAANTRADTGLKGKQGQKIDAEIAAANAATGTANADKVGKTEQELRKEFQGTPMFTQANEVNNAYRKVLAAPPDPKGDIALVYSYVKILDPGSVVREGEIQLSKEGRSYETQVKAWLAKAQTGEGFTKEERAQFRSSAKALYDAQMQSYTSAADNYRRMATERGVNPGNVVLDMNIGTDAGAAGSGGKADPLGVR